MKKRYSRKVSRHHIIPKSRGGKRSLENIAEIEKEDHRNYHNLFENKMPFEIIEELVNKYWNGNWDYVKQSQKIYNRH